MREVGHDGVMKLEDSTPLESYRDQPVGVQED
jgi:hypothetical protein